MKRIKTNKKRAPLFKHLEYSESYKEIIYMMAQQYSKFRNKEYAVVSFKEHMRKDKFLAIDDPYFMNKSYAYGLLINPAHANMLVLDFDNTDLEVIKEVIEQIANTGIANHFDIASSSRLETGETVNRHLYVGLNKFYNTYPFYGAAITGVCKGYLSCIRQKREVIIRVSNKFNSDTFYRPNRYLRFTEYRKKIDTEIHWEKGYSKEGNIWLTYSSEQLIAPLTTAVGAYLGETRTPIRQSLKLRG